MSEQNTGQESDPNNDSIGAETTPFKSFKTEEDYNSHLDPFYRNSYNNGVNKVLKGIKEQAKSFGIDYEGVDNKSILDHTFSALTEKLTGNSNDTNKDIDQLKQALSSANTEKDSLLKELTYIKDSSAKAVFYDKAFNALEEEGKLVIPREQVRILFESSQDIQKDDNGFYVNKDGVPLRDDNGNKAGLDAALVAYAKANKLYTPNASGAGGGSGSGSIPSTAPKYEDYLAARSAGDRVLQNKLIAQADKAGKWAGAGAPLVFNS